MGVAFLSEYTKALKFEGRNMRETPKILKLFATPFAGIGPFLAQSDKMCCCENLG
jgi:hypothetical protein